VNELLQHYLAATKAKDKEDALAALLPAMVNSMTYCSQVLASKDAEISRLTQQVSTMQVIVRRLKR
jgi:hypothetical protein